MIERSFLTPHTPKERLLQCFWVGVLLVAFLAGCRPAVPTPSAYDPAINLDADTQARIAKARRVVFLIPFSHWDTDWHQTFEVYSRMADHNIQAAIDLAKEQPRFRYTLEQVLFVEHFWETHPESRADLKALIQNRQISFAWAGMTQPETSLAAPGVQWHNLLAGQNWIAETFGQQFIPTGAWQSDAFGDSAALPVFLSQAGIRNLFLGRWRQRCPTADETCQSLPQAFYWKSPLQSVGGDLETGRILVASVPYATAWGNLLNKNGFDERKAAFQALLDEQFSRGTSRYLFLPYGFDFLDPDPALLDLVEQWNAASGDTALVVADPETAYHYLASQDLPEIRVDLNPLWQAFYGTRPYARIADKESEFYLTATDKFGQFLDPAVAGDWITATINAHYDNLSAVGYDQVWDASQRPRFEAAVNGSAEQLSSVLAGIAGRVMAVAPSPSQMLLFNALSWPHGGVIEVQTDTAEIGNLQGSSQPVAPNTTAIYLKPLPPVGYAPLAQQLGQADYPARGTQAGDQTTLTNGLISVSLNAARGGTFERLFLTSDPSADLLAGPGDDLVYIRDSGDVYGARFGDVVARQSQAPAHIDLLAVGPLLARARITLSLGGQPVTKTVTLRADSPLVEVTLQMRALPETSALMWTSTALQTTTRTDDLGFAAYQHPVDPAPIQAGDITYRRNIFYPITYWSDVSTGARGLSLITHGLQGIGGTSDLTMLLARSVSDAGDQAHEGVNDTELHTFRYAYYPHQGDTEEARPWIEAYNFNQPVIPAWRAGDTLFVQLPFQAAPTVLPFWAAAPSLPETGSLASIQGDGAVLVDAFQHAGRLSVLVVNYEPSNSTSLKTATGNFDFPPGWLTLNTAQP